MTENRNPILIGQAEVIDLLRPDVRAMVDHEGLYVGGDTKVPHMVVPLVSQNGRIFSMKIDEELDPERFLPTLTLHGPYFAQAPAMDALFAQRALSELGHEPITSDRCTASVVPTAPEARPPGPSNPPIWCHLKAGHEGPHRCNHGGGYPSFPFRESDPVEFREPAVLCVSCRTLWPCKDAKKVLALVATEQPEGTPRG